ncbi:MAG: sigma-70 family RNA polymerase sigma factor, partial [Oscillospiraceae bacterium]|nr:sigma-70 family RNA polymerase sigma factor [Oscillospiraceae bacterium]
DEKEIADAKKEIEKDKLNKKLRSAIKSLTDTQKKAIELYYFSGYKQKEIAEEMGCTQGNISNIISRALTNIRKKMNK